MKDNRGILIIGKIPPPIGGVTIHVKRLIEHLSSSNVSFYFVPLNFKNLYCVFKSVFKYRSIHVHVSNVWVRLLFSFLSLMRLNLVVLTYHGNLGRYNSILDWVDYLSVRFSSVPVVLNKQSLIKASSLNDKSILVPAFIPPLESKLMNDHQVNKEIILLKSKFRRVFSTNASNVSFDNNGNEVYGIRSLIALFNSLPDIALIISDPSGGYKEYLKKNNIIINDNIKILSFEHSFYNVLKETDGLIRSTTTDGDSLSVKEALYLGKNVYCSDCVDRPQGVILFQTQNFNQLKELIVNKSEIQTNLENPCIENGFIKLKKLYISVLK